MFRKSILLTTALAWSVGVAHAGDKPLYQPAPDWVKTTTSSAKLSMFLAGKGCFAGYIAGCKIGSPF